MNLSAVRRLLEEFFRTREALTCPRSATGGQLEALRMGMVGKRDSGSDYKRAMATEERYMRYAVLVKIWNALTTEEQTVIYAQYEPIGSQEYLRTVRECELQELKVPMHDQGGECLAETRNGGRCKNKRIPGEARCRVHEKVQSQPVTKITSASEEYVMQDADNEGFAIVRGTCAKHRRNEDIAKLLGISLRQVKYRISTAYSKIENHCLYHLIVEQ